ncbi:hypothetical protein JY651_07045 [Pyxidicoccus parkwayensis]|uniref:Uncharacterized protein n=1 Tax=Pyxidicoccus parkwayensis TaxID=2813578 RepID=A0ABX7P2P2_9BACT|nr:hypothetical protein [Pyxidicoccus parkwaysis]QSQ24698.1 hypothetical protein JY651_07045 [Pyxidicoccus parkwaysis]
MISFKQQLAKIGHPAGQPVSYRSFFLAPPNLRATLRSMDFPSRFWEAIPGTEQDKDWTEEIQGVAFAHNRWFYVSNASDAPRLYVFDGPSGQKIKSWNIKNVPAPNPPIPGFSMYHFGAIAIDGNFIYIDHWCDAGGQILVFEGDGATLNFVKWIPLENVNGRVGMVAINFAQRMVVTAGGAKNIDRVYLHSLDTGRFAQKTLMLNPRISDDCYVQGGFWSPNNHLYISSGQGGFFDSAKGYQYIYCYSPLNGQRLGTIPVRSAAGRQELEGCCYAAVTRNGQQVYFHAVLLENEETAKDDIFLKSFSADLPELI